MGRNRWFLSVLLVCLAGCASSTKKPKNQRIPESAQDKLQRALKDLDQGNYSEASDILNHLLVQHPGTQFDLVILYNSGIAYENLQDCSKALNRYRQVVRSSGGKYQRIEAQALFRMSKAYECLGDQRKTLMALLDARRRSSFLPKETAEAELPARLAVAYARLGRRAEALKYFQVASNGLKKVLAGELRSREMVNMAARTLYYMGQLSAPQRNLTAKPDAYLQALSMQQPYLLQAAELSQKPYSKNASDDLKFAYENILKLVPSESAAARKYLEGALQDMAELNRIRLPGKGPLVDSIFEVVDAKRVNIRNRLIGLPESNPLTPSAKSREGLRRQGEVKGRPSILEKQSEDKPLPRKRRSK